MTGTRALDQCIGIEQEIVEAVYVYTPRTGGVRAQAVRSQVASVNRPPVCCEELACLLVPPTMFCKPMNDNNHSTGFRDRPRLPEQVKPVTGGDMATVMMNCPAGRVLKLS